MATSVIEFDAPMGSECESGCNASDFRHLHCEKDREPIVLQGPDGELPENAVACQHPECENVLHRQCANDVDGTLLCSACEAVARAQAYDDHLVSLTVMYAKQDLAEALQRICRDRNLAQCRAIAADLFEIRRLVAAIERETAVLALQAMAHRAEVTA